RACAGSDKLEQAGSSATGLSHFQCMSPGCQFSFIDSSQAGSVKSVFRVSRSRMQVFFGGCLCCLPDRAALMYCHVVVPASQGVCLFLIE
ncbi:hypothetical protein, partial [Kerstersia sp.]|uniref:hypothetical protein n=1 Tax=Kerstersia sp. TaxID=1930783 RepID=UPI003F906E3B